MSNLSPQQFSVYRGISISGNVDPDDDEAVLGSIRRSKHGDDAFEAERKAVDPDSVDRWPLYGQHWTTSNRKARDFSLRAVTNTEPRGRVRSPLARTGVVLEAITSDDPRPSEWHRGFGEQEVVWGRRSNVQAVRAHIHHLPADAPVHRTETHRRTIDVPPEHWR